MDAAVDIRPTYSALGFAAEAAPVRAMVGGQGPFRLTWKETLRIPAPSGTVMVVIWSAWVTKQFMGTCHALLTLGPDEVVGLGWKMPQTVFGTGKLALEALDPPTRFAPLEAAAVPPDPGKCLVSSPHPVQRLSDRPGPVLAPAGGAWHPDPSGRHPLRWWDGTQWTDAVSDGTSTGSDPLTGSGEPPA